MGRYLRLYRHFIQYSFSRSFEFRLDFFFRVVMDIIYYAMNVMFFVLVFDQTPLLSGWSREQVFVFTGGFMVLDALQMTLISNNMWALPQLVNNGGLDYYLVRPISSLFFVSLRDFAANSFLNLAIAVAFWGWSLTQLNQNFGFGDLIFYVILMLNGMLIFYCARLLTVLPVFWTHSNRGFDTVFWNLQRFMERPDRIFSGVTRFVLLSVLPFSLMASVPAGAFFDGFPLSTVVNCFLVSFVFSGLVALIWKWALQNYSSASS